MRRNKRGVSLIVLSITILVMAILAATAIIALEDSGIIGRSKNTVSKQNYTEEYTRLQVIKNGLLTDNLGEITVDQYITELTNKGVIESGVTTNSDGSKSVTTKTGFVANIIQDGESNLIISLGEANSAISLSPVTLTGDITNGEITKTIIATTKNVTGDITWTSSNSSVAAVTGNNSSATVTLKNVGTATITATYGNAKASCEVTVTGTVATPTITLDKTTISKTIDSGSTATETITVTTANISGTLTWTTSNSTVATVSASGNTATVTMKAAGTATITATYGSTSASCTVVVTENEPSGTVTITSASISPTTFSTWQNIQFNMAATIEKSVPDEELTFNYKFYSITSITGEPAYQPELDISYTTTSNSISETATVAELFSGYGLIELHITNKNGEPLTVYKFEYNTLPSWNNAAYTFYISCLPAGTLVTVEVEEEDDNGKKKKRRKKKKIEDLTYEDNLVVWDFDNGCFTTAKALWLKEKEYAEEYNLLTFSDGSTLKTIRQHRIFNKELGKFTYPMSDETPVGTTTFNEAGEEVTLVSKEVVEEKVAFYNVISEYHMNVFAEGILTSCRLSNLYDIKDMKYVKDNRELTSETEFEGLPEEYINGLRLREQPVDINRGNSDNHGNTLRDYVNNLIRIAKKK